MSFMAAIYPQFNVELMLHCQPHQDLKNLQVIRIKNNGVVEVSFRSTSEGVYNMYLDRLQNETVRITWEGSTNNENISAVAAAPPRS